MPSFHTVMSAAIRSGVAALAALHLAAGAVAAQVAVARDTLPDGSAQLRCLEGVITEVRIETGPVFVSDDATPRGLRWLFGLGNLIHVETRPGFIRKELLFEEGDCFDPFLLSESERLLDQYRFLTDVRILYAPDGGGGNVVTVTTRDTWSTQVDLGLTYDDGLNAESFRVAERNFLGYGVEASANYRERRNERTRSIAFASPRLLGRTDAEVAFGRRRGGSFFEQSFTHRFVGEAARLSWVQGFARGTDFFSWGTGTETGVSNLLVPIREERVEVAAAWRFGRPGRSGTFGVGFERDVRERSGVVENVIDGDFDRSVPDSSFAGADILRQTVDESATRFALYFGLQRTQYQDFFALDAMRDRQSVGLGTRWNVSLGRSIGAFAPTGVPAVAETHLRTHLQSIGHLGNSLFLATSSVEAARGSGAWRNVFAEAEVVAWLRRSIQPRHTLFLRASFAGGWETEAPFQLALGGRDGVRSLRDDAVPGGRRLLLVAENRSRLDWWRSSGIDLGLTLFADYAWSWAGDAPYGVDSSGIGSLGFGIRIASPTGSRFAWRPDIAFPLGHDGSPVFRLTLEVNRFRNGFFTTALRRSLRFARGTEHF